MTNNVKKFLILRLSALGDTIHTLPLAYCLKKTYPDCKIGWVVEDKAALFVQDSPLVDECYVLPKKSWKKRGVFSFENLTEFRKIISDINSYKYDCVLDTQQLLKSSLLLPFLNIKRKITLTGGREFSGVFSNEKIKASHTLFDNDYHVVKRNLEFASYLGADISEIKFVLSPALPSVVEYVDGLFSKLDCTKRTIVLAPATTWENKHWQEKNWAEIIDFISDKANIVFTGMESDLPLIERIVSLAGYKNVFVFAGQTNLNELAEVYRRSDIVISPDSGSVHIAWAVDKPKIISLFFATPENRNAPFGDNCYVVSPQLSCRPCMKRKCKLRNDKNLCACSVSTQDVVDVLQNIL